MTRLHAKAARIYVDEFDFAGVSNSVDVDIDNGVREITAFLDTDTTWVEGKPLFVARVNGFFSTASPDYDGEMFADLTAASRRLGIYPRGNTDGNRGYELVTNITESPRIATTGGAVLVNVTWEGNSNAIARAQILDVNTAVGATGAGTAFQRGAVAATETVVGVLRLLASPAGAGNNTLDVKIQSDDNEAFTSPTDKLIFTQLNQASVAIFEVQTAVGIITDQWWRVYYTYAGAGSRTFSLVVTVGIRQTG